MSNEKVAFHKTLDGPYIFTNSRPIFFDIKILWALMYHYRNQQRSSFHFHRLNLLMKNAKRFRSLELEYIDTFEIHLLDSLILCMSSFKEAVTISAMAIEKLIDMKLYLPFALVAEAGIASIFSKLDYLESELVATKKALENPNSKPDTITPEISPPIKKSKIEEKPFKRKPPPKKIKADKLSKLSSNRLPSTTTNNGGGKDEIDSIFGDFE